MSTTPTLHSLLSCELFASERSSSQTHYDSRINLTDSNLPGYISLFFWLLLFFWVSSWLSFWLFCCVHTLLVIEKCSFAALKGPVLGCINETIPRGTVHRAQIG